MKKIYSPLFTPWKIRDLEIKNRIVMTSMGGTSIFGWMEPAHFDKEAAKFLLKRAQNNVGLILPGIAPVKNPMMGGWLYSNKGMYKKLKSFMDEFHKTGAKLFVQLTAGFGRSMAMNHLMVMCCKNKVLGALLKPVFNMNWINAAPSVLPNRWDEEVLTKEITEKQILEMIDGFAKVSKLCKDAGVDGIEVHAVHEGYLLDQFTLPYSNFRTDKWGGNFENRYRFPVEIVKAIKNVCGEDFPVTLRYSVVSKTKAFGRGAMPNEEFIEIGRAMEESERAAKYLQDAGYDMLNCDNGTYDAWYWAHPPGYMPQNCNLDDVAHIKKFVDIPVVCAGRMSPDVAAKAIAEGKIDAMGVARQFLVDPEWVTKLMEGREKDIQPCILCHNACFNMAHYKGVPNDQTLEDSLHMARCALNPETMQSKKYKIVPAKKIKNIAVIGGGIGGMETAMVLAKRGHTVSLFEKSDKLGGIFIAASTPPFKEKDRELIEWYRREIKKYPSIKIFLNTNIDSEKALAEHGQFDEVVVATGSKAKSLKIKGIEKTIEAIDYLENRDVDVGNNPIIIGGGLTGCEVAYDLSLKGKKPSIIEMKNDLIAARGVCLANSSYLRDYFLLHETPVYLETSVKEVKKNGVIAIDKDDKEFLVKGSKVILSIGYVPTPVFKKRRRVHLVGDCKEVGNLRTVIWRAWDVAMKL
ncbi:MAG TPA: FAD-dependent oxidoreductase [Erysipelotrichaceae bacterium]|nr:FAD-dependent oxidoreductase [Erysipelotrichaceae bacterium]